MLPDKQKPGSWIYEQRMKQKITDYLSPLFPISRLFGLLPYNDKNLSISKSWMAYSTVIAVFLTVVAPMAKIVVALTGEAPWLVGSIRQIIYILRSLTANICIALHVFRLVANSHDFSSVLSEVNKYNGEPLYTYQFLTLLGFFVIISNFILEYLTYYINFHIFIGELLLFLSDAGSLMVAMQFCVILEVYRKRMNQLSVKITSNYFKQEYLLERYQRILDCAQITNRIFSLQILVTGFEAFVNTVYFAFYTIEVVQSGTDTLRVFKNAFLSLWQIFKIYNVAAASERLVRKLKMISGHYKKSSWMYEDHVKRKISSYLSPLFPLSRIFGLLPYNEKNLSISKNWMIYSSTIAVVFTLIIPMMKVVLTFTVNATWLTGTMRRLIYIFRSIPANFCICFHVFRIFKNSQDFSVILSEVNKFEGDSCDTMQFLTAIGLTVLTLNFTIDCFIYSDSGILAINFLVFLTDVGALMIAMLFCVIIGVYKKRMNQLAQRLTADYYRQEYLLERYQAILDAAQTTNKVFAFQMLITGFEAFVNCVYFAFYALDNYTMGLPLIRCTKNGFLSLWQMFKIYNAASASERLMIKAEYFNSQLFKHVRDNKELCRNKKLSLYLTMKQNVNFSACGFFTLGYPLITSIIAAATTYVVILFQFSSGDS